VRSHLKHAASVVLLALLSLSIATACDGDDGSANVAPAPLVVEGSTIDVHTHLMSAELAAILGAEGPVTADDLVARMDEANVDRAVVLSTAYMSVLPDDAAMSAENDFVVAQVARFPDRLIAFCGINPLRVTALGEIDRCVDELGVRGIKLHLVGSRLDMTDPAHVDALARVFERVQERRLPVLLHAANPIGLPLDSDGLTSLGTVFAQHPDVRIVLAHCFSPLDNQQIELITEGIRQGVLRRDQLFLEISACLDTFQDAPLSERELIVWRLRKFGLDRIFFGSDYLKIDPTAITPADTLRVLAQYPFTQDEINLILRNDASAWLDGE
jgi:predicted TIM-barrel fold metal-dependent hydrolase